MKKGLCSKIFLAIKLENNSALKTYQLIICIPIVLFFVTCNIVQSRSSFAQAQTIEQEGKQSSIDEGFDSLGGFPDVAQVADIFQVLEEAEVYASTRTLLRLKKTPGSVFLITSEEIERLPVFTVPDILRLVPGVFVSSTAMGERMTIRGFGEFPFTDKILFLIDGVPWNSPDKGGEPGLPHWDLFPIEQIKQIEVVKGPGSVLFGKNAFWGVINIVTKDYKDTRGIKTKFTRGERDTLLGTIQYGGKFKELEWSFLGKVFNQDGSIDVQKDSQSQSKEGYLKLRYKDLKGNLYFQNYDQENFFFSSADHTADFGVPDFDFDTLGVRQNIANMHIEYQKEIIENLTSTTRFSFQYRRGDTCASCHFGNGVWGSRSDVNKEKGIERRFFASQQIDYDFGSTPIGSHFVSLGFEGWYDTVRRDIAKLGVLRPAPFNVDNNIQGGGVFLQDQWSFLDDKLNFTLGARLDHHEKSGTSFTKSIQLVALPTEKLTLRASFSDAFKPPNWNDMYLQNFITTDISSPFDPDGFDILGGGPDLDNESIRMYQVGIEYRFTPQLSVRVDGYYSEVRDLIFPVFNPAEFAQGIFDLRLGNSQDTGRIKGGELEVRYQFNMDYSVRFGYDYQNTKGLPKGEIDLSGNKLGASYAPRHKFHTMLFTRPIENLTWDFSYTWTDNFWAQGHMYSHASNPFRGRFPSYGLLGTGISYKLPSIKNVETRILASGENLFNTQELQYLHDHDANLGDGITNKMVGRRFTFGFEFKF